MSDTPDPDAEPADRRHDLRVQDAVGLHLQRLDEMVAAGEKMKSREPLPQVRTRRADKYTIEGYGDVRREHPQVADYVDELEERIRQLLLDGDPIERAPTHKVSLSAGGIAFADKRLFEPGELVGVTLTLFPSGRRIGTDARIVSANDAPEVANGDRPNYRLIFLRMNEADRRALDTHIATLSGARRQDHD